MNAVSIRRGLPGDAAALAAFAEQCFIDTYATELPAAAMQAHLSAAFNPAQQQRELSDPDLHTLLLWQRAELLGFAQLRCRPAPGIEHVAAVELQRFYLDQRVHGRGLAALLMAEVRALARRCGGRWLWLAVWEHNPRAIAFYRRQGFADVGSTLFALGPERLIDRVMMCALDQAP